MWFHQEETSIKSTSELTKREHDTLEAIKSFLKSNQYPPTIKEIADIIKVSSTSTVSRFLVNLEGKGFITRQECKPRSMRILQHT